MPLRDSAVFNMRCSACGNRRNQTAARKRCRTKDTAALIARWKIMSKGDSAFF